MQTKKNLTFTGSLIQYEENPITFSIIKNILDSHTKKIDDLKYLYKSDSDTSLHILEINYENPLFVKIVFKDANANPRSEEIYNVKTLTEVENPRTIEEAEPKISYCLIDVKNSKLWLSNSKKTNALVEFLNFDLNETKIFSRDVFDKDVLLEKLTSIDELRFGYVPNLINNNSEIDSVMKEDYNLYESDDISISFNYSNRKISDKLKKLLGIAIQNQEFYKSLVICGKDQNNLGLLFNKNELVRRMTLVLQTDSNGNFDEEDVFISLKNEIYQEKFSQ